MVTHWNPNLLETVQHHSSILSMITHCPPKEKLITKEEFLALLAEFHEQMRNDRAKILEEIKKCSLLVPKL